MRKNTYGLIATVAITSLLFMGIVSATTSTSSSTVNNKMTDFQKADATGAIYVNAYSTRTTNTTYHMWTVITDQWGNTVYKGFTPVAYGGISGVTYTVTVSNYRSLIFDHWGSGGTTNSKTYTFDGNNAWFDAYYKDTSISTNTTTIPTIDTIHKMIPKTGIVTPLYMYPGSPTNLNSNWQQVIKQKLAHPSVPMVAIINPNSGPGWNVDSNFVSGVNKLRNAGVIVLGYTYSNYGSRPIDAVKSDIDKYAGWYHTDGVFIDEMQNRVGSEWYYKQISDYAHSSNKGMKLTMGNPGTDTAKSYIGTVDIINTSEGSGYTSLSDPNLIGSNWVSGGHTGWHSAYDKRNFSYIRYGVSWLDTNFELNSAQHVGLLYIHSGNDSNGRWFSLPSYYAQEVATLDI